MIREDCYWHSEEPDMGARLHLCSMKKGIEPLETCDGCENYHSRYKRTKGDRIRAMSDEELADEMLTAFAAFYDVEWSKEAVLDWLRHEAKEGET